MRNQRTAAKWYRLAAKKVNANAQYNLGEIYCFGQGVPNNHKTAVKYYKLAAEQGFANAKYNLGLMYSEGNGVPRVTAAYTP